MKKTTSRPLAAIFILALLGMFGVGATAQDDLPDPYVISARAGTLNLAENGTEVRREEDSEWEYISARKRLHSGDSLRTTGYARAEMLLNPGSYLRLANDAEVELTDAALDRLHVTVRQGAVIFEVTGTDGTDIVIRVTTPDGAFYILKPGIYRVQVVPNGPTEIRIRKGQIELGDSRGTRIKGRKRVYLDSGNEPGYGDLAKNDTDEFDNWSEARSERLADANARLTDRDTRDLISGYRSNGANGFGYAPNFGLWIYNGWLGSYTFYPFFDDWFSPYGRGYSACYRLPWASYRPVIVNNYYPSYGSGGSSPAKPPAPVFFPSNPGGYNPGYSTTPNPGGYNNGPVNAPKPSGNSAPAANDYRYGPAPRARDKAPGTVPSYTPPPSSNTRSGGGSSGGSNSGGSSGAQGGSRNTGGDSMSKPAPAPQAPARPAPAPQAPTKGGGKSPNND
jgi:hypothetical protein